MLRTLPTELQSQLRSTFVLSSLVAVVDELVQNSLDAGALKIDVAVNAAAWSCRVSDDGHGLSRIDLARLGDRYSAIEASTVKLTWAVTSKCRDLAGLGSVDSFGFRGEALASLCDIALVEITSRRAEGVDSHCAVRQGGKRISDGIATQPLRSPHGTVVQVRDLFYKWPVRRKSAPSSAATIEHVKRTIEALALIHPGVAFSLADLERIERDGGRVITVRNAAVGPLERWQQLWGAAAVQTVDEVTRAEGGVTATGFISHCAVPSKQSQYIYVNKRSLANSSAMHKAINSLFARSSFARHAREDVASPSTSPLPKRRSPSKVADRWPVFMLALEVPATDVDLLLEPSKKTLGLRNEEAVIRVVVDLCADFLRRHGYSAPGVATVTPRSKRTMEAVEDTPTGRTSGAVEDSSPSDGRHAPPPRPVDTSKLRRVHRRTDGPSALVEAAMDGWRDPVLETAEAAIRSVAHDDPLDGRTPVVRADRFFDNPSDTVELALPRDALDSARFIAQIDRKFLLCRTVDDTLVLIDQHAADERVRVERLLDAMRLDHVKTVQLHTPVLVLLRREEVAAAMRHRRAMARWGVSYSTSSDGRGDHGQIEVTTLPKVVADRLCAEPTLLKQLIRHHLLVLDAEHGAAAASTCPLGLVELVNSRACRGADDECRTQLNDAGAIMFGDELSVAQAERLIAQLAQTRLPFQCAHGRPSLAPIVRLAAAVPIRRHVDLSKLD